MIPLMLAEDLNRFYSRHYPQLLPLSLVASVELAPGSRAPSAADAYLLIRHADAISDRARHYLDFVSKLMPIFRRIEIWYNQNVKAPGDHKDAQARPGGWAGYGMLPLALALYTAIQDGTEGDYLECGVFKGGSLACMSHVCALLGVKAIAADTFNGLPESDETGYWQKGQFTGQLDEVQAYVKTIGCFDAVEWRVGLFADTLPTLNRTVALMFLDTDLYSSSSSALAAAKLVPASLIASDGVGAENFTGARFTPTTGEATAIGDFFGADKLVGLWTGNGNMSVFKRRSTGDRLAYSTAFTHLLSFDSFFPSRYTPNVGKRRDAAQAIGRSDATEARILDQALAESLERQFALSYLVGGLEWRLSQAAGPKT